MMSVVRIGRTQQDLARRASNWRSWTMAVLVLAACSDPSQPAARPASIQVITGRNVAVAPQDEFAVTVLVTDASDHAVADATVVFQVVRLTIEPPYTVQQVDTVRTDASGAATIEATVGPVGAYQVIASVTDAQIEPAIVNVYATQPVDGELALGAHHSCVLSDDGTVYCWGAAPAAGVATETCGTSPCVRTPRPIASVLRFEAIAAGGDQTCALSQSALYCWGRGAVIPGGEGTTPQRVPGSFSFTSSFTVGSDHACATTMDGEAYCWGDNSRGQLGTGDLIAAATPTPVLSAERFTSLHAGPQFTCGHTVDRTVHCWGANAYGQLGRGTVSESEPVPAAVLLAVLVSSGSVDAGAHACMYTANARGLCWGRNESGQLGEGPTSWPSPRAAALGGPTFVMTSTGTCSSDGKAFYCQGAIGGFQYDVDSMGQGHGLTAGGQHACARIAQAGYFALRCWGDNSLGALGDGTLISSRTPVEVVF